MRKLRITTRFSALFIIFYLLLTSINALAVGVVLVRYDCSGLQAGTRPGYIAGDAVISEKGAWLDALGKKAVFSAPEAAESVSLLANIRSAGYVLLKLYDGENYQQVNFKPDTKDWESLLIDIKEGNLTVLCGGRQVMVKGSLNISRIEKIEIANAEIDDVSLGEQTLPTRIVDFNVCYDGVGAPLVAHYIYYSQSGATETPYFTWYASDSLNGTYERIKSSTQVWAPNPGEDKYVYCTASYSGGTAGTVPKKVSDIDVMIFNEAKSLVGGAETTFVYKDSDGTRYWRPRFVDWSDYDEIVFNIRSARSTDRFYQVYLSSDNPNYSSNDYYFTYFKVDWGGKLMSSFDKLYGERDDKKICIKLMCADDIEAAYRAIGKHFHLPLLQNISGGGFCGEAVVRHIGRADAVQVKTPDGSIYSLPVETPLTHIPLQAFGLYTVTPMLDGKHGLNTTLWYGKDYVKLYQKACEAIQKPYHNDENLCEGGCFLWALLNYMRITGDRQFESLVREELAIVMGERDYVARKTIVPHPTEEYAAYHIHRSGRIQEQVFGASILLEAYLLFKESRYLEFAISALREMMEHDMVGGKLLNGSGADYTTVCCPVIPFADMAVCLAELGDNRAEIFKKKAIEMADYLLKRGMDFPTETELTPYTEKEMEDGSISCTALSLLYVCIKVQYNQRYIDFAKQVLHLHKAWTIYTPDVRMYQSSFRWWETIWEGDGEGPAICAGHAWTIWTSEALFYLGLLTRDDEALLASWNGFLTNFSKTQADGSMYSCYEPDYIRGGGIAEVKQTLLQLRGEDTETRYRTAHSYPEHTDSSLSRYAWVRGAYTWQNTAAILLVQGELIGINIQKVNGEWIENNGVTRVYISPKVGTVPLHNQNIQEV